MAFFRKRDTPEPPKPAPAAKSEPQPAAARQPAGKGAIEVSEGSLTEEAAVLFANNQAEEAATILRHALRTDSPDRDDPRLWRMLCDLYVALGLQSEFEKLALEFAIKFERSPPIWRKADTAAREMQTATTLLNVPATLNAAVAAKLSEANKALEQKRALRIDLGKVQQADAEGCQALLKFLKDSRRAGQSVSLSGVPQFATLVKSATEAKAAESVWLLLLEVYQFEGRQNEFEDLAVDYAVAFELSPPSWETPPSSPSKLASEGERQASESEPDDFFFEGISSGSADPQLEQLAQFGQGRRLINLNLSRLNRLDFGCAGSLLALITKFAQEGKTIRIVQPNELVLALLGVLGVEAVASIVRFESS